MSFSTPIPASHTASTLAGSFVDGLRSYQRSQLVSNFPTSTESDSDENEHDDLERGNRSFATVEISQVRREQILGASESVSICGDFSEDEGEAERNPHRYNNDSFVTQTRRYDYHDTTANELRLAPVLESQLERGIPSERTPLMSNFVSLGSRSFPRLEKTPTNYGRQTESCHDVVRSIGQNVDKPRRVSESRPGAGTQHSGSSTFGQTLFNTISALVGIGILSEPLAFSYAGWFGGTALLTIYALVSCYTAILLTDIMFKDSRVQSYADIGRKAFGKKSVPFISILFCLELFTISVVLVTLFADSLNAVLPVYSITGFKLLSLIIIIPTALLPLSFLAYASVIGILATVLILAVLFIDGLSKTTAPGSLLDPCETHLFKSIDFAKTGTAFGLFIAGFSGHSIVPALALDMKDPTQFRKMIRLAFAISACLYAVGGVAGYLMLGENLSDEISQDLIAIPGYPKVWNQTLMWMLVVMPISKFALSTRPLSTTFEGFLGLSKTIESPRSFLATLSSRTATAAAAVSVSIAIPEFQTVMAFLGSFSAFTICVIGPISAHIRINGARWWDVVILIIAIVMAVWGTAAAFLS